MKRVILGWVMILIGGIPFPLVVSVWVGNWFKLTEVPVSLLITGGVIVCIGVIIKEWGWNGEKKKNKQVEASQN